MKYIPFLKLEDIPEFCEHFDSKGLGGNRDVKVEARPHCAPPAFTHIV